MLSDFVRGDVVHFHQRALVISLTQDMQRLLDREFAKAGQGARHHDPI
jgi:hypothetical protein